MISKKAATLVAAIVIAISLLAMPTASLSLENTPAVYNRLTIGGAVSAGKQSQVLNEIDYFCKVKRFGEKDCNFIKALAWIESWLGKARKILDSNAKFSYGIFHYQLATFKSQGIKYGFLPKDTTDEEAEKQIYDDSIQIPLTMCLYEDNNYVGHWANSVKKIQEKGLAFYLNQIAQIK